ncbi:MAG: YraN family protein [bacterium]
METGNKTHNQQIGKAGEDVISKYLINKGYTIIERNYWKKYGEIDIVAKKDDVLHFVEVKSVSYENKSIGPCDNMTKEKRDKFARIIEIYLSKKGITEKWQIDLALVYLNLVTRKAKVDYMEDIEL